jgi:PAS domain S-box-containing protein
LIFGATSIVAFIYTISYLELKNSKKLYNLYLFLIIVISIFTILVATKLIKAHHSNFASPFMYLSGTFIMLITGIIRYKDLKIPSLFYLSSFGLFFISSLVWMLVLLDVIHYSIFLYHINSIVVGLFSIVLSIGLFDKISTLKTEKIRVAELELSNNKLKAEIIEREAIELLLEESENKFRLLFEWSPLAVSITDYQKGLFLDVNRKFCELAGLSKIQIIGRNSFELEFFSMADREIILQHVQNNKENLGVEFDFKLKNNKLIHSIIYPYKMNLKGKPVIITIISDITQVKQNQKEIKKLLTAIEQSANTVLITNNKGIIEFVNPYFINLTGYLPEEVIGKTPSILKSGYHPPDFYSNIWKTIKNGEKWVGEFYNKKKNGDFYWESATITPITNDNGNITHFMAIKEDITEKKQQQIILVDSERKLKELNATKDKFFSIIAHDLMNPFNALLGFSSLTVETVQNQEHDKTAKYIVYIDKLAKQISNLFQNLLIWSRAQSGNLLFTPMPVDICEVISDTVNLVEQIALKKNIRIHYEKKAPLKLMIDQNMISTVVRNLVSNAIKFSNNGGNIYITTEKLDKFFLLIISDDGIGMDANIVNELFRIDKTHTTKGTEDETGTGLGLVICKEFIDMHKGKIWAESTPGKGSRFFVKIPLN